VMDEMLGQEPWAWMYLFKTV